jgi:uncharacterized membrane protein
MARVFVRLVLLVVALVCVLAILGSLLPRGFTIEQQVDVAAPVDVVFAKVNDLNQWRHWSPWRAEILGAEAIQIGEPFAGSGAKMQWQDPRGTGKLWFTECEANRRIAYEFAFGGFREMRGDFRFARLNEGVQVRWTCRGSLPGGPFYGFFGFLFRGEMERQFQASLQRLKQFCESPATATPK